MRILWPCVLFCFVFLKTDAILKNVHKSLLVNCWLGFIKALQSLSLFLLQIVR